MSALLSGDRFSVKETAEVFPTGYKYMTVGQNKKWDIAVKR